MDREKKNRILEGVKSNTSRKKRVFKKLNKQILGLTEDVTTHFMDVGESFYFMSKYNLFDFKYENFDKYLRDNIKLVDRAVVYKLIRTYKYFKEYFDTERGRVFLYVVGWTKLLMLVEKKDKFRRALDMNVLNFDDLTLYAYQNSVSDLEDLLDEQTSTELCKDVFLSTHRFFNPDPSKENAYIEGFMQILDYIDFTYGFPYVDELRESVVIKYERGALSEQQLMEIFGYIREIARNYNATLNHSKVNIDNSLTSKYLNYTRPADLVYLEGYAIYKEKNDFGLIINEPDGLREKIKVGFLSPEDVIDLTGLEALEIYYWTEVFDPELQENTTFSRKDILRCAELAPQDYEQLDRGDRVFSKLRTLVRQGYDESIHDQDFISHLITFSGFPSNKTFERQFSLRIVRKLELIQDGLRSGLNEKDALKQAEKIINEETTFRIVEVYRGLAERVDIKPDFYWGGDELRSIRRKGSSKKDSK